MSVHEKYADPDMGPRRRSAALLAAACAVLLHAGALGAALCWIGPGREGFAGPNPASLELALDGGARGAVQGLDGGPPKVPARPELGGSAPTPSSPRHILRVPEPTLGLAARETKKILARSKFQKSSPASNSVPTASYRPAPWLEPARESAPQGGSILSALSPESAPNAMAEGLSGLRPASGGDGAAAHGPGDDSGRGALSVEKAGPKAVRGGDGVLRFGAPGGPAIARLVRPEYPREARRAGREGLVVLKLFLDAKGAVSRIETVAAAGFGMDEAAKDAVLRSRFRPATSSGQPVACQAILSLRFELR